MPRGWIYRLKKSHDLEMCTRHTCRGTLGDGVRQKKILQPEVFFSRIYKLENTAFFGEKNIKT